MKKLFSVTLILPEDTQAINVCVVSGCTDQLLLQNKMFSRADILSGEIDAIIKDGDHHA